MNFALIVDVMKKNDVKMRKRCGERSLLIISLRIRGLLTTFHELFGFVLKNLVTLYILSEADYDDQYFLAKRTQKRAHTEF